MPSRQLDCTQVALEQNLTSLQGLLITSSLLTWTLVIAGYSVTFVGNPRVSVPPGSLALAHIPYPPNPVGAAASVSELPWGGLETPC